MTNIPSTDRLSALETILQEAALDLYIVPMVDEFQGEYTPAYAARLPYVTGFTGSAGMGVFWAAPNDTRSHTLFVDGRYTLQAANEVDTTRITVLNSGEVSFRQWIEGLNEGPLRIGIDPWLLTLQQAEQWQEATRHLPIEWVIARPNYVDTIWGALQPEEPHGKVWEHPQEYAGQASREKRAKLTELMTHAQADAVVLTQADAINWLLNIRGEDIPFNPLMLGYLVVPREGQMRLYSYTRSDTARAVLLAQDVRLSSIVEIFASKCAALPSGARVMMDRATVPYGWAMVAKQEGWDILSAEDPVQLPKALKNTVELDGIRAAHLRDGLALTQFLCWLDERIGRRRFPNELEIVARLEEFRARAPEYRGASFATIAGSGPHGAIIHYRADGASNRKLQLDELFLLDSGGQYPDGTTDVTRTVVIGTPSPVMKEHFTRVLKGHIALAAAQFPVGTSGSQLDVLARQYLWQAGLDFDHGTGHGVGAYLCVHEGPQRISKRGSNVALQPGMILSNEPGYYEQGQYGIRIESLVAVTQVHSYARPMLAFETLTLVPIDTRLVETSMLTSEERNWLNAYHRRVYDAHLDQLTPAEQSWLAQVTRAV